MLEKWKEIVGYEGLYEVSNYGNVMSFKVCKTGKLMIPNIDKDGYWQTGLRDRNFKRKWFRIHRLVAIAFIPNPLNLPQINHKDTIKSHCYESNLEWCTVTYNNRYRFECGYKVPGGENHSTAKLTNEQALKIFNLTQYTDLSDSEIALQFGIERRNVNDIKLGQSWSSVTGKVWVRP